MGKLAWPFIPVLVTGVLSLGAWSEWVWGPRAYQGLPWVRLFLAVMIHFVFVGLFVLGPVFTILYAKFEKRSEFVRMGAACAYTLLPMLAYAYYFSVSTDFASLHELFTSTVPAVVAGLILFEFTRSAKYAVWMIAMGTFVPYFLCNDILGPFNVFVQFVPKHPLVPMLRALSFWLPVVFATLVVKPKTALEKNRFHASGCLEIFSLAIFVHLIAPLFAVMTHSPLPLHPVSDSWWVSYLLLSYFLFRKVRRAYWVCLFLSGALGMLCAARFVFSILNAASGVWEVLGAQYYFISGFVLMRLFLYLVGRDGRLVICGSSQCASA